jgi:hypothetical protein
MPIGCALLVGAAACGKVVFGPSPATPVGVELAYSPEEDLTRLRWSVADDANLTFELSTANADFTPIAFDAAPYPSGSAACGNATCYQLVARGRLRPPTDGVMIRSRDPDLGVFRGNPVKDIGQVTPALKLMVSLSTDNATLGIDVEDWLAMAGIARTFRVTTWAEPTAPCAVDPSRPDDPAEVAIGPRSIPFTTAPTVEGRYCARAHPEPHDGGAWFGLAKPIVAAPDLFREVDTWQPPVEEAPVVWRMVTDLEIVDGARCTQVGQVVHQTWAQAFSSSGAPSHELAAVDLAPGCQQSMGRAIDAGPLADDAKSYVAAHYPNQYQAPILVYVNNLDVPLPSSLITSLGTYQSAFVPPHLKAIEWGFAANAALQSFPFNEALEFVAIEDPQFSTTITNTVHMLLPFKTQLHMPDDVLLLMPAATVTSSAGDPWKVCQASPSIVRLSQGQPVAPNVITLNIDPQDPPSFTVDLPPKILVPSSQFMSDTVVVRYEICRRWCDHPFTDEGGAMHDSWLTTPACLKNSAP